MNLNQAFMMVNKGGAALTCTIGSGANWVNTDTSDYYSGTTTEDHNYQEVANSASKNICKIDLYLANGGPQNSPVIKLKSGAGGTLYGTSDTVTVPADSTIAKYTFTFSPAVTVPGDFIVVVYYAANSLTHYCASGGSQDSYFGGTSYKATTANTERGQDWSMEIWYEQ